MKPQKEAAQFECVREKFSACPRTGFTTFRQNVQSNKVDSLFVGNARKRKLPQCRSERPTDKTSYNAGCKTGSSIRRSWSHQTRAFSNRARDTTVSGRHDGARPSNFGGTCSVTSTRFVGAAERTRFLRPVLAFGRFELCCFCLPSPELA